MLFILSLFTNVFSEIQWKIFEKLSINNNTVFSIEYYYLMIIAFLLLYFASIFLIRYLSFPFYRRELSALGNKILLQVWCIST